MTSLKPLAVLGLLLVLTACDSERLRGETTPSGDGRTYFAILEYNGDCTSIMLDGEKWPHPQGEFVQIAPGTHTIGDCYGGEIGFDVPTGVRFGFDYWGP